MSRYQKLMATAIAAVGLGFTGFAILIMGQPAQAPVSTGLLTVAVLGYLAFVFSVLAVQQRLTKADLRAFPDEREAELDIRAEQIGYRTLEIGIFVLIGVILLGSGSAYAEWGRFNLARPEGMIFALILLVTFAALARLAAAFAMDRRV